jgi:molybdopterin converting factor small subunit
MPLKLRFYANMRTAIGRASLEIANPGLDTFRKLVTFLIREHPETAFHLTDGNGNLRPDVPVYVDGRNPRLTEIGLDTPLLEDSEISFFSPISSGKMNVEVLRDS